MSWEALTFGASIAVLALQAWNLYVSVSLKLWAVEKFVTKEEAERRFVSKGEYMEGMNQWAESEMSKRHA